MIRATAIVAVLCAVCSPAAWAAREFSTTIKNAGLARTLSNAADVLKTTRLEANRTQMLEHPSVEFLIELEHQGRPVILAPGDFRFHSASTSKRGQEQRWRLELRCVREGFPLTVFVDYYAEPRATYQQKSVTVGPSSKPEGARLKRVVIEDFSFRRDFVPLAPADSEESEFGAIEPRTGRGVFFFVGSTAGRERFDRRGRLIMWEEVNAPLNEGYTTGRATIGSAAGSQEVVYSRFRDFAWKACFEARGGEAAAFPARFAEFRKRFQQFFAGRTLARSALDGFGLDLEAYTVDGRGFLVLFNPTRRSSKIVIPLEDPALGLRGKVKLFDWTALDSASDMGEAGPGDPVELELEPLSARIIGLGIEG